MSWPKNIQRQWFGFGVDVINCVVVGVDHMHGQYWAEYLFFDQLRALLGVQDDSGRNKPILLRHLFFWHLPTVQNFAPMIFFEDVQQSSRSCGMWCSAYVRAEVQILAEGFLGSVDQQRYHFVADAAFNQNIVRCDACLPLVPELAADDSPTCLNKSGALGDNHWAFATQLKCDRRQVRCRSSQDHFTNARSAREDNVVKWQCSKVGRYFAPTNDTPNSSLVEPLKDPLQNLCAFRRVL
mmetsp:Transcript_53250/g.105832  ORF Transcript_53250/g.105832 Transcript_53250/m.105832 type:complete len:239 (-) Transcript_53250:450-1166(-)